MKPKLAARRNVFCRAAKTILPFPWFLFDRFGILP
jgi:hypothetical protein